jgi:ubiquinone/menaquinone biosynthesis C-methylase UbiE
MNWHQRYRQQAEWTRELRRYIFDKTGLKHGSRLLEVGCGTGVILSQLKSPAFGLDIALDSLKQAKIHTQNRSPLSCGDARSLPFANDSFDLVFCHFLLLWLPDPLQALAEMRRVVKAGGEIIAFAEPNYEKRIDSPAALAELGKKQTEALRAQGANPGLGATLSELFFRAGIRIVEAGTLTRSARVSHPAKDHVQEWAVLEADLAGFVSEAYLQKMKRIDQAAREKGERILYVPTHYVWGRNAV